MLASSGSPARISRRRRSGPGRTTCPFVETLVCMVRPSYTIRGRFRNISFAAGATIEYSNRSAAAALSRPQHCLYFLEQWFEGGEYEVVTIPDVRFRPNALHLRPKQVKQH